MQSENPNPIAGHISPESNLPPMFDSLEEERAFHARKAEDFKSRLNSQVTELKTTATNKARTGAIWGGAFLASFVLLRGLTGSRKRWVESPAGPFQIKGKESVVVSLLKASALVGAVYLSKDKIAPLLAKKHASDEKHPASTDHQYEYDNSDFEAGY
jgi:hypothetical protein